MTLCRYRFRFLILAGALLAATQSPLTLAQDAYPSKPVKVVVGFSAGGATDILARMLAERLSKQMNASFIVENRDGANGNIAGELVSRAAPDGYTILHNTSSMMFSQALGMKIGYDPVKDLAPVSLVATNSLVLVAHPSVPVKNLREFIAYAKANPGKLAHGSPGIGNISHLAGLLFEKAVGIEALHVPYRGAGPAMAAALGGQVQFLFDPVSTALPVIRDNRLKVLAVASEKRLDGLPDVPTFRESGINLEVGAWQAVSVPARTPTAVIERLNAEIVKALLAPDFRAKLAEQGTTAIGSTPAAYATYTKAEIERWTDVVRTGNVKVD